MATSRLVLLWQRPTAAEVEAAIVERFDVTRLGGSGRWTVAAGTAHMYLDYDPGFASHVERHLSDAELAAATASLCGRPRLALHAQISSFTPGSGVLADEVIRCVLGRWRGVVWPV